MGMIESKSARKRQRTNLKKAILKTLYTTGVISLALLAPNVLGVIAKSARGISSRQGESIHAARKRLVAQGLIAVTDGKLRITSRGERELRLLDAGSFRLKKPKRWDGRWRVLIFDIPEKRRALRFKLRKSLVSAGFVRVQDSVWLYPYECEDFTALLKADFRVGKELLYMIVDSLEGDKRFREYFKLS
jgi:DNA-binding transcriptional regulator PaaX